MKKVLVVVDMQEDFIHGSLGNDDCRDAVKGCVNLCAGGGFDKIVFTRDTHLDDYPHTLEGKKLPVAHCIKDTKGWNIVRELEEAAFGKDVKVIDKVTFGSVETQYFGFPKCEDLVSVIKGWAVDKTDRNFYDYVEPFELHFCGVCTSICVLANMVICRAHFPNTRIVLHTKATGDVTEEMKQAAFVVAKAQQCDLED